MDIDDPLMNVLVAAFLMSLIPLAIYSYRRTKKKAKVSFLGDAAIFIGSLVSPHHEIVKEVKATIRNKVKRTDPQDKDD